MGSSDSESQNLTSARPKNLQKIGPAAVRPARESGVARVGEDKGLVKREIPRQLQCIFPLLDEVVAPQAHVVRFEVELHAAGYAVAQVWVERRQGRHLAGYDVVEQGDVIALLEDAGM